MSVVAILWISLLTSTATLTEGLEKCCPGLGCFNMDASWSSLLRPVLPPRCTDIVVVKFYLYTRNNQNTPQLMASWPNITMNDTLFDGRRNTLVYIHGWRGSAQGIDGQDIVPALLSLGDVNVILVDYSSVSKDSYFQVVSDLRTVAKVTAMFYTGILQKYFNADPTRLHIIGSSLGAHTAGYTAREIKNVSRVTGLDPAGFLFSGYGPEVRLNKNDADFVDIGHTNIAPLIPFVGFGIPERTGDLDFYFNGGWNQPGCRTNLTSEVIRFLLTLDQASLEQTLQSLICPHARAFFYFLESVKNRGNCTFWGITRRRESAFLAPGFNNPWLMNKLQEELSSCDLEKCSPWGLEDIEYPARGSFDVGTSDMEPFCIPRPDVDAKMAHLLEAYDRQHNITYHEDGTNDLK